jgi:hypothetical protein
LDGRAGADTLIGGTGNDTYLLGRGHGAEVLRTSDGHTLMEAQVQNLVNAMAAFSPPSPGQTELPPDYAVALNPVIAANWQ